MKHLRAIGLLLAVSVWAADNNPQAPCTVSGRIVNAVTGEPLKKAQLTLSQMGFDSSYSAATDEGGGFCLAAVGAGTYELVIQKRGFVKTGRAITLAAGENTAGIVVRIVPQGVIAGRVVDREGDPLSGVTVQAIRSSATAASRRYSIVDFGATNDLGEYRIYGLNPGRYYLGAAYRSESGYAAIYFPDVPEASRAVPIDVPAGGELNGLNLTVSEIYSLRIRGTVESVTGVPVIGITVVAAPCDAGPLNRATTTVVKSDGAFELRDLTPGCYMLAADSFSGGRRYSARLPVTVAGQTVEKVKLSLAPPVQLTGRVRIDDAAGFPFHRVIVNLEARFSKLTAGGAPTEDGSLLLKNIVPEIYELNVIVPDGYYLKSAKYGQDDVLSSGLDLTHGATGALELEIAADGGSIEGSIVDGQDGPVAGERVALIPDDPSGGPSRQRVTITDSKGAFIIRGIAPGGYKLYASGNLDVSALRDPAYVKLLGPHANTVSIVEHGLQVLHIRAIGAGELPF